MGKTYGKPQIYIESFQLNAAVATGCGPEAQALLINETGTSDLQCMQLKDDHIISAACEVDAVGLPGNNKSNPDNACYHAMLATLSDAVLVS